MNRVENAIYNLFAATDQHRLASLSDGVFAVVMTLLVLNLHVPASASVAVSDGELLEKLRPLVGNLLIYVLSFLTLGIFWVGQQTQLNLLQRGDRNLAWIHLAFLLMVTLIPFSTALLAAYSTVRLALVLYWLNILLLGAALFATWHYSLHAGLVREDTPSETRAAIDRRIVVAQAFYAVGAALCLVNTYISIGFIVLVQLNYVIAPRIRPLYRL
jgi:uncharacterized membrane protein